MLAVHIFSARKLALALAFVISSAVACSGESPTLPPSTSPTLISERLSQPDADEFLLRISTYEWSDGGEKAGSLFNWVGADATSTDPDASTRARLTALRLASFLAGARDKLTSIPRGFRDTSVGERNPELVKAYAAALTPFQGSATGNGEILGFKALGDLNPPRAVFAVIATEKESAQHFTESAYETAKSIAAEGARAICSTSSGDRSGRTAIRVAGILSGLASATADSVGLPAKKLPQVHDDIVNAMALACVPLDKTILDGYIVNYVKNGHLLTREQILQDPEAGLEDYYQSQFDYLANRGFAVVELSDWYRKARNI